ncbi:MAG: hypothetical protein JNK12_04890 [Acidimicrobiales bacterium]|nr:hypothetical protein [Acidimicrobiales bacterium]
MAADRLVKVQVVCSAAPGEIVTRLARSTDSLVSHTSDVRLKPPSARWVMV